MPDELIEMYRAGAITGYQVMLDSLHSLDPAHPERVLGLLPDEVLDEVCEYAARYDASRMRSAGGPPPAEDQVRSAARWVEERRRRQAELNRAS